jgi:hypothetical protein
MSRPDAKRIVRELLSRHGRTFGEQLGIDLEANTPSSLFQCRTGANRLERTENEVRRQAAA